MQFLWFGLENTFLDYRVVVLYLRSLLQYNDDQE
jgi:hypothetical protein